MQVSEQALGINNNTMMKKSVEELELSVRSKSLEEAVVKRVLVLDGGMGTMIQKAGLTEADFSGSIRLTHGNECGCDYCSKEKKQLRGCNDILAISRPDVIEGIHRAYLQAGADIIETDSFNANAISLADYGLSEYAAEINMAAAAVARKTADSYMVDTGREVWVAGSMGPTSKSLTMAVNLGDTISWSEMEEAYFVQAKALIAGGVDVLIIETVFDVLNAKAAIHAARRAMCEEEVRVPLIISGTLTQSGRTLSGMTPEAMVATVAYARPLAVGLNCGFGASDMIGYIRNFADSPFALILYPNAGLPNEFGEYDETPDAMAATLRQTIENGGVNIIGGCCGTTPQHIAALREIANQSVPRNIPEEPSGLILAGLEPLYVEKKDFVNVGERCNVAGSRKFLRLIKENNTAEALGVAADQIVKGADVIDVNMDDGMLDAVDSMSRFLKRVMTEPSIARVPVMVDSSDMNVVDKALQVIQGRPVVNSISLKEGEEKFLERACEIHEMGAAMVVMAFDEEGQATTAERRFEVCRRAYKLLTEKARIAPTDIIFDPNVLAIATGLPEHNNYGRDFLRAVDMIMTELPGVNVSGGLSNLSFSFRGNDYVRNAMHSIFIDSARRKGMKMAIVNPAGIYKLNTIAPDLSKAITDVINNSDEEATDRLIAIATEILEKKKAAAASAAEKQPTAISRPHDTLSAEETLKNDVVNGLTANLAEDVAACLKSVKSAIGVIDNVLMESMNVVGDRFGRGEMFLPQVVKSASVMQQAVSILTPEIEREKSVGKTTDRNLKMVIATVKGDVHDIGKNIVDVVLRCNGFEMIDLGVMTPAEKIVDTAIECKADCVGLSGLITPSLAEMVEVAREMERRGLTIPLFIGGATTSKLHTAVKIAPEYSGAVIHTPDAAALAAEAKQYLDPTTRHTAITRLKENQRQLRENRTGTSPLLTIEEARSRRPEYTFDFESVLNTPGTENFSVPVSELRPLINFRQFLSAWELNPNYLVKKDSSVASEEATRLLTDANELLDKLEAEGAIVKVRLNTLYGVSTANDNLLIFADKEKKKLLLSIPLLRKTTVSEGESTTISLADYFPKENQKPVSFGLFCATVGREMHQRLVGENAKSYDGLLADLLLNRLAEAATEWLQRRFDNQAINGIRPAIGYPSLPDQSIVLLIDRLLDYKSLSVDITQNGALFPSSTTTGLLIYHPVARYFSVGRIGTDQKADYASRRGFSTEDINRFLPDKQ